MVRHLIITSHPSSKGFTHKIAKSFLHKAHESGAEAEILDLYNPKYKLDNLKFEDIRKFPSGGVIAELQDKIRLADNIVFIYPKWWYGLPGIMKNFVDTVISSDFGFKYVQGKMLPVPLLKGKTCQIFTTCDGPRIYYLFVGNLGQKMLKLTCSLCGIKVKSSMMLYSKRTRDEKYLDNWLNKVERKV
jgi:putative NADPH-quinone reductase